MTIVGNTSIGGTLAVTKATTLSNTLAVAKVATFQSSVVINDQLTVKGNTVIGDATGDAHKVNGNMTHNGNVYLANGTTYKLDTSGNANLNTANAQALQLDNKVKFVYNSTDKCVDVIFI
jgi:UDP-3-O-[3-hydroxymyristoyl] glucosamine N-acyltransferase